MAVSENIITQSSGTDWVLYNGDCIEGMKSLPDDCIGFGIHSPPFANLYIYSSSDRDMGNCASEAEFFQHYRYAIEEMLRVTIPGRCCAVHCKDLPRYANVYGTTGLIDFPGAIIYEFESAGWVYHSRVTIWKCPVIERERTNNNGLLHKTVCRDTSQVRQGMADYLIVFRKPPLADDGLMSAKPIVRPKGFDRYIGEIDPRQSKAHPSPYARKSASSAESIDIWQRYADPVWWDINQVDVLNNYREAGSDNDVKHICPLQLGLIERAVHIWSDDCDVVLSPFAGIGSEGVGAIRQRRKFCGFELKPEYFDAACANLRKAEKAASGRRLFDLQEVD